MVLEFFRGIFGLASSFVRPPVVRADDGEDEEDELQDPMDGMKIECSKKEKGVALRKIFDECNTRVRSKKKTKETCEEELHDLVKFIDHCVSENLFFHLK